MAGERRAGERQTGARWSVEGARVVPNSLESVKTAHRTHSAPRGTRYCRGAGWPPGECGGSADRLQPEELGEDGSGGGSPGHKRRSGTAGGCMMAAWAACVDILKSGGNTHLQDGTAAEPGAGSTELARKKHPHRRRFEARGKHEKTAGRETFEARAKRGKTSSLDHIEARVKQGKIGQGRGNSNVNTNLPYSCGRVQ